MTTSVWSDRSDIQAAGSVIENVEEDFCYLGRAIFHLTAVVRRTSKYELEKQHQYLVK